MKLLNQWCALVLNDEEEHTMSIVSTDPSSTSKRLSPCKINSTKNMMAALSA